MNRAMHINHGMAIRGATNTLNLEARGKSQLLKELNECCGSKITSPQDVKRNMNKIVFVREAIHKNEMTNEVEPYGLVDEIFDIHKPGTRQRRDDSKLRHVIATKPHTAEN